MGVTYKLKDEVVRFIISDRQANPLFSCRQLAESASQKFDLHLSKSSVHDVLKEAGIITPRGRKPKDKFKIPQEKKKQIQANLSQVKLLIPPAESEKKYLPAVIASSPKDIPRNDKIEVSPQKEDMEISAEYEGAGKIFLKAILWDLGIFSEESIKESDWDYYLTYTKGIKIVLENNKDFFIDLGLPIERCIREVSDGLINNINTLIVYKTSDEMLFKACMDGQTGFKINKILVVDQNDHDLIEFCNIMEFKRNFISNNRLFVENNDRDVTKRLRTVFFPQLIDGDNVIDNILNLKGFDTISNDENIVNLIIDDGYKYKIMLQQAAEKLNGMYLRDDQSRLLKVILSVAKDLKAP